MQGFAGLVGVVIAAAISAVFSAAILTFVLYLVSAFGGSVPVH